MTLTCNGSRGILKRLLLRTKITFCLRNFQDNHLGVRGGIWIRPKNANLELQAIWPNTLIKSPVTPMAVTSPPAPAPWMMSGLLPYRSV